MFLQWNPGRVETKKEDRVHQRRNAFSLNHIKDSLNTCFKWRPNNKRFYLLNYTAVMLTIFLPFFGEFIIGFSYVRTRYGWGMVEYSDYSSICRVVDLVGQGILIPLLGYLELCDTTVIPVIISTIIARHVIKGLAYEPYLLYVASAVDLMGGYAFSAARSAVSKCVEMDELGKVSIFTLKMLRWKLQSSGVCFALLSGVSGPDHDVAGLRLPLESHQRWYKSSNQVFAAQYVILKSFSSWNRRDLLGRLLLLCLRHPHHHCLHSLNNWLVQVIGYYKNNYKT